MWQDRFTENQIIGVLREHEADVKTAELYRKERLTVRKRSGRKRALGMRASMAIPQESNQRWSLDVVSDALACESRRFRVLNVIDDYSRECLACIVDTSLSGRRVVRELTAIAERRGLPCMVVSDNVLCREAAADFGEQISKRLQPSATAHAKGARTPKLTY